MWKRNGFYVILNGYTGILPKMYGKSIDSVWIVYGEKQNGVKGSKWDELIKKWIK